MSDDFEGEAVPESRADDGGEGMPRARYASDVRGDIDGERERTERGDDGDDGGSDRSDEADEQFSRSMAGTSGEAGATVW